MKSNAKFCLRKVLRKENVLFDIKENDFSTFVFIMKKK